MPAPFIRKMSSTASASSPFKKSRSPRGARGLQDFLRNRRVIVGPVPSPGGLFNRLTRIKVVTAGQSAVPPEERCDSPQHDHQNEGQTDDAVARDPFFVAHRAQALNAAGGQVIDQPGVIGGWAVEMFFQTAPRSRP